MNLSPTHVDINVHQARPSVHSAADTVFMNITIPGGDNRGLDHTLYLYFASTLHARMVGEALMREAYRVEQMQKLKTADVSAAVAYPDPGSWVTKGPNE